MEIIVDIHHDENVYKENFRQNFEDRYVILSAKRKTNEYQLYLWLLFCYSRYSPIKYDKLLVGSLKAK